MIETKHLLTGSPKPPLKSGVLRLYSMRFCPFAHRAMLVLHVKNIPHEQVNINLKQKPEWLFEVHPLGKVPSLEMDGDVLFESLLVADFLDEKYPQVPLYPKDPMAKAKERLLIDSFDKIMLPILHLYYVPDKLTAESFASALGNLDVFEKELTRRGTPFFGGDAPSMVDLMMWPMWERFGSLAHFGGDQYKMPTLRFPKQVAWIEKMKEADGVKEVYLKIEIHCKYLETMRQGPTGSPDYDMLVKV